MARLLVFVLCASMVTTQRNGNVVKDRGELQMQMRDCAVDQSFRKAHVIHATLSLGAWHFRPDSLLNFRELDILIT